MIIRTELVTLTTIPAVAFRQKLLKGGAGIVVLRHDCKQPGIASVSKTSGKAIPTVNTPMEFYPQEALDEALELTYGMPYHKRSAPTAPFTAQPEAAAEEPAAAEEAVEEAVEEEIQAIEVVIDSKDYQKIVDTYTDKNGKLSYSLLNKDLIQFAHVSTHVKSMVDQGCEVEEIGMYVVSTKFRNVTGNKNLTDEQIVKISELLDEVSPKGVYTELNQELRRMLNNKNK